MGRKQKMKSNEQKNYQTALRMLDPLFCREDHCDGANAIYRLSALYYLEDDISEDGLEREIKKLIREVSKFSVRPDTLYVHESFIEIDWYPESYQMVMNRGQYIGLVVEFAKFLNECPIKLYINDECFYDDDPEFSVRIVNNDDINFFPQFNQKCFGLDPMHSIEVVNLLI